MPRPAVTRVAILEDVVTRLARRGAQGDLGAALMGIRGLAILARVRDECEPCTCAHAKNPWLDGRHFFTCRGR